MNYINTTQTEPKNSTDVSSVFTRQVLPVLYTIILRLCLHSQRTHRLDLLQGSHLLSLSSLPKKHGGCRRSDVVFLPVACSGRPRLRRLAVEAVQDIQRLTFAENIICKLEKQEAFKNKLGSVSANCEDGTTN